MDKKLKKIILEIYDILNQIQSDNRRSKKEKQLTFINHLWSALAVISDEYAEYRPHKKI